MQSIIGNGGGQSPANIGHEIQFAAPSVIGHGITPKPAAATDDVVTARLPRWGKLSDGGLLIPDGGKLSDGGRKANFS